MPTTIAQRLEFAARFSHNATFLLFAMRIDGTESVLIFSTNSAEDMESEYRRYAINGQYGDCLEIRCNKIRVKLDN